MTLADLLEKPHVLHLPMPFGTPEISDQLLEELTTKIRPVVIRDGLHYYLEPVDPRKAAFTWHPKVAEEATNIEAIAEIPTLHVYGAPAFFKPSIAEVLAQIPAGYLDRIVAFQTIPNPESINDWPEADHIAMNWGYHIGITTLYEAV